MSTFTRSAVEMLRAAEGALSGKNTAGHGSRYTREGSVPAAAAVGSDVGLDSAATVGLLRELRLALGEIADLRAELAAERDARSAALLSLGQRWKEEVLCVSRADQQQLRRDVAELEMRVGSQLTDLSRIHGTTQMRLDELARGFKVQHSGLFEERETLRDELESLRRQVDAATTQSSTTRVECTAMMEREREALSHRLDTELLRYVSMRQDDQREASNMRAHVRAEVAKVQGGVADAVESEWRRCSTALERALREPAEETRAMVARMQAIVHDVQADVKDTARTCQADLRAQTAALQERLSRLESSEAVANSRVDRAEKKADAVHATSARTEAAMLVIRETVDRASAKSDFAAERAQRVEDVLSDRDARLVQMESQMHLVSTAEKIRAEVEAVKRASARVESRVDAMAAMCERGEAQNEASHRAMEEAAACVQQCERASARAQQTAQAAQEQATTCAARVVALEATLDRHAGTDERLEIAVAKAEQRTEGCEARIRTVAEKLEYYSRDAKESQHTSNTRLVQFQEAASRAEALSLSCKTEVERQEKRMVKLEATVNEISVECASLRTAAADTARDVASLERREQQTREWAEARESRVTEVVTRAEERTSMLAEKLEVVSARLRKEEVARSAAEDKMQVVDAAGLSSDAVATAAAEKVARRMQQQVSEVRALLNQESLTWQQRLESVEASLSAQEVSARNLFASSTDLSQLRRAVSGLESQLKHLSDNLQHSTALAEDATAAAQQRVSSLQVELTRLRQQRHDESISTEATQQELEKRVQASLQQQQSWLAQTITEVQAAVAQCLESAVVVPGGGNAVTAGATSPQTTSTNVLPNSHEWSSSPSVYMPRSQPRDSLLSATQPQQEDEILRKSPAEVSGVGSQDSRMTPSRFQKDEGTSGQEHISSKSRISSISSVHATTDNLHFPSGGTATLLKEEFSTASSGMREDHAGMGVAPGAALLPAPEFTTDQQVLPKEVGVVPSTPPVTATEPAASTSTIGRQPPLGEETSVVTLGGAGAATNTSVQRTMIQRFSPFDDTSTDDTTERSLQRPQGTHHKEERTEDVSTASAHTETTPIPTPDRRQAPQQVATAARAAAPQPSTAWLESSSSESDVFHSAGNTSGLVAGTGGVTAHTLESLIESARNSRAASVHEEDASKPVHQYDDWDDTDDEDTEGEEAQVKNRPPLMGVHSSTDSGDDAVIHLGGEAAAVVAQTISTRTGASTPPHSSAAVMGAGGIDVDKEDVMVSPSPVKPSAHATLTSEDLKATPRKMFISLDEADPLKDVSVPTHGKSTTSSSSGGRSSAEQALQSQPSAGAAVTSGAAKPEAGKYTSFDDSDSD